MFGWFRPRCPVDPSSKVWVEGRLEWLGREFGPEPFLERPLILPTPEFFPELASREHANLEHLFRRVCGYMGVDRERFELEVVPKATFIGLIDAGGHAVGEEIAHYQYDPAGERVRVREQSIGGPFQMVAVLAHELAHARLLGEGRLEGREIDNELTTDLTALYHGFGVFLARHPQDWIGEIEHWPGTRRSMAKYMNAYMFGWALAHQAWLRMEEPTWFGLLPSSVRASAKAGLRYLRQSGDSAHVHGDWKAWNALHGELRAPCGADPDPEEQAWGTRGCASLSQHVRRAPAP